MVGLLAYVTSTQVDNAVNLDRAPDLINATSLPAARFGSFLEAERTAAVVYLSDPSPANLQAYQAAIAVTDRDEPAFKAAMTSPATVSSETPDEARAISAIISSLGDLTTLRIGVQDRSVSALDALSLYSQGIAAQPRLFLLMTNSEASTSQQGQAIGLITTVQAREELSQEQALLAGALAGQRITGQDRIAFTNMAAARKADLQYAEFVLTPANLAIYNAKLGGSGPLQQQLGTIEQAVEGGTSISHLPITLAQWQSLSGTLLQDEYSGGVAISQAILASNHQTTHAAWVRVAVTGGIALLGLVITVLLTSLVGRSIIRRLRGLETSALTLAQDQLPEVIGRLRHGENVDVALEAPPLQAGPAGPGSFEEDEIGRVSQAFDLVRQTALRAAVDEARLRQGLNDVFRSLARRSQSLLHRQLTLLDQMERRASDPEALEDLFRLDHLTTRMRRHAEGLVILAGAPPSRGWSSPVRMVDVMRGAVAEVEDYARVSVATRSQAALAGSAVADVIHLLAELIENATTLSPPYTSVRVSGDTVANGFAIEVEDRGVGMNAQRLAELNDRLASPPEFNPSDSEQLGLFVVGQLAKRHGIRVTLKASPYGGTAAIVLVPRHLIVTGDALQAGLPGEPAATAMPGPAATANGRRVPPADAAPGLPGTGGAGLGGVPGPDAIAGLAQAPGIRISGPLRRSQGPVPDDDLPQRHPGEPAANGSGREPDAAAAVAGPGEPAPFDAFGPRHRRDPGTPAPAGAGNGADPPAPAPAPAAGATAGPQGGPDETADEMVDEADQVDGTSGLPRRVKQASLAPQLRAEPPRRRTIVASGGPSAGPSGGPSGGPSPADLRRTMSALQRGRQEGRSQANPGSVIPEAVSQGRVDQGRESPGGSPGADTEAPGTDDGT